MKKKFFFPTAAILITALIAVVSISGVYAFFTQNKAISNEFNVPKYNVKIEEEFTPEEWEPDTPMTKKAEAVNNGGVPVVIRISYAEFWKTAAGEYLNTTVNGQSVPSKNWNQAFSADWTLKNGWYYYTKVLNPGERAPILDSITLLSDGLSSAELSQYQLAEYHLYFTYESVQADSDAIETYWGLTATINGDTVTIS